MKILGISAFYHDSAAVITVDGEIIAAAQEERFSRIKHDADFPKQAIEFCLDFAKLSISDLDAIVFYDKPLLKFERLIETYYAFAPKGWRSFVAAMPVWMKEKLFLKRLLRKELSNIDEVDWKETPLLFPEHHLSHAASAFYPSPFDEAAILTLDGVGEWTTTSVCHGKDHKIEIKEEIRFPHSLGLLYSAFTYFLGFEVNSGEYKLMGLAPYGNISDASTVKYIRTIKSELIELNENGSFWLNQKYFSYATALRMVPDKKWESLFGIKKREIGDSLSQEHCNLALAIQKVTEEAVLNLAKAAKKITGSNNLCLAGGVALNCVANGVIDSAEIFENIFVQPAAGDAGGALGAALSAHHIYFDLPRKVNLNDGMKGALLGPCFNNDHIRNFLVQEKITYKEYNVEEMNVAVAGYILDGKVVGWMQGRMEFGPRALGNRSILGDPSNPEMQKKINQKIKFRESFRPFAPAVLAEDCPQYFMHTSVSPYMLMVKPIKEEIKKPLPENYQNLKLTDKLAVERSLFPSISHVDFTARIQTVDKTRNRQFYSLLQEIKNKSGHGMVVNTSFNVKDEPIVCSPEDAYRCFLQTDMDVLVMENFVILKTEQS